MAPALLRKLFDKPPPREDHDQLLTSGQSPETSREPVTKVSETGTDREPSSTRNDDRNISDITKCSIQICPHETLSFERMKRILGLPNFKYNRKEICAFTNVSGHYQVLSKEETYQCRPRLEVCRSLKADAFCTYNRNLDGGLRDLIVTIDWTMKLDAHMDVAGSLPDMQRFLDRFHIELCRHMFMSHPKIATKLLRLCNPEAPVEEPVEGYEEMQRRRAEKCPGCNTTYDVYKDEESYHVLIKRYLGPGKSAYYKGWLDQCGEKGHALRSFGAATMDFLRRGR